MWKDRIIWALCIAAFVASLALVFRVAVAKKPGNPNAPLLELASPPVQLPPGQSWLAVAKTWRGDAPSNRHALREVVRTPERWREVWEDLMPVDSPPAPEIDFSTNAVICAARSEPGFPMTVLFVWRDGNVVNALLEADNSPTGDHPFLFAVIPAASNDKVEIVSRPIICTLGAPLR